VPDDIEAPSRLACEVSLLAEDGMTVTDMVKVTQYLTHTEEIKAYATVRARFLGSLRSLFHGSSAFPWSGITNLWCLRRKGAHQVRRARYRVSLARHGYVCRGSFVKVFRENLRWEPHGQSAGIQLE
jgi:hypothetical protein